MAFDFPRQPTGDLRRDMAQMWEDLFRLVEQLRLMEQGTAKEDKQDD